MNERGCGAERLLRRVVSQLLTAGRAAAIQAHVAHSDTVELRVSGLRQDVEPACHERDVTVYLDVERIDAANAIANGPRGGKPTAAAL